MWATGKVGFHQSQINDFLITHWPALNLKGHESVLVPLCGKSLDMLWLQQRGHNVLGVELSQQALQAFLTEAHMEAKPVQHNPFCGYESAGMTLLCGDFFKLRLEDCSDIRAVYDRAAIVALPPQMRQAYVLHLKKVLPTLPKSSKSSKGIGVQILMVTLEYDQSKMSGPPFSVTEPEVRDLFGAFATVNKLCEVPTSRKGLAMLEKAYLIQLH